MSENLPEKSDVAKREEEILEFWNRNDIFRKSEEKEAPKGEFVFYDGPPFATGLPHYGHILAGTIKDAIPRYKTMCGYRVRRRWGWDCHGLPLENEIEKELGLKTKRDIETYGIDTFNKAAQSAVLRYADDWKRIVPRMGRFVDMENDYRTMDASYTESVWWAFSQLHRKGLIYEGFKSMHLCPRCGTTLSNFEVNQGYKDTKDIAVTVKLKLPDESKTSLLIWTTTTWTLPGNAAAAVNPDIAYVKAKVRDEYFILAKDRLALTLGSGAEIIKEFPGSALVGRSYEPPFSYYKDAALANKENAWKVYGAPFVSTEEGTGIVHIAPAFGEEDLSLSRTEHIPVIHHVTQEGVFAPEVKEFAGLSVKPKGDPRATDGQVATVLEAKELLVKKEEITHSYPFCWRCDTPLLNYAASSWFVDVPAIRNKIVAENKKVVWVPGDIRDGRFGKWLEGAREWAISRSRYWGAPLPVWKGKDGAIVVIGSVDDLRRKVKTAGNRYSIMRHGQAENNVQQIASSQPGLEHHLTEEGREEVRRSAATLKGKIDIIVTSPLLRTRETAELVARELGLPEGSVTFDERLREVGAGDLDNKPLAETRGYFKTPTERYLKSLPGGESTFAVRRRVGDAIYDLESRFHDKRILIVTHGDPLWMLKAVASGLDTEQTLALKEENPEVMHTAETYELPFVPLPHNESYELDLHRPYIDAVTLMDEEGRELTRIPEVFDCWFESGSMPFAQQHHPFDHRDIFDPTPGFFRRGRGFPADFIAEGLDQTRGWFYSLLVLSVGLFGRAPYRHVIVNGTILAADGQKMSKRLKNYPDPMAVADRFGVDALRLYLLSSPVVRAEDFNFSEQGVADIMRKNIVRLSNVVSFLDLYRNEKEESEDADHRPQSQNILDRWILVRLAQTARAMTDGMERYELDRATRPIADFIDDLSTWYLRRSRDRFKSDDSSQRRMAVDVLRYVLLEFSKLIAPFMPFYAEYLYRHLKGASGLESVHLESWPVMNVADERVADEMKKVRDAVTDALEQRAKAGIKVRQPLASFATPLSIDPAYEYLIKDEANVKEVKAGAVIEAGTGLSTDLTDELREEGLIRDLIRRIQELRKQGGLTPGEEAVLTVETNAAGEAFIESARDTIQKATQVKTITFGKAAGEEITLADHAFVLEIGR